MAMVESIGESNNDNVDDAIVEGIEVAVDAEQEIFGAIDIYPRADQLYHPLVEQYRSEPSRLVKCLSVSPQCHQIDDKSVPRTLRPSKSADLNSRVHLDTNDESRVSPTYQCQY